MAIQEGSFEYSRLVALEAENQALRQQVVHLSHLLQVKDAEILMKSQVIQSREHDTIRALQRLQILEASMRQAEEVAHRTAVEQASRIPLPAPLVDEFLVPQFDHNRENSGGPYDRDKLLRLGAVMGKQSQDESEEQSRLMCKRIEEASSDPVVGADDSKTPQDLGATTPSKRKTSKPSTGRQQETAEGSYKALSESLVGNGVLDIQASEVLACSGTPTQSSPGKRSPPALDLCGMLEEPASEVPRGTPAACVDGGLDMESTPNKRLPIVDPETMKQIPDAPVPVSTPSKRLQITDPKTGKAIEVTPNTETSRIKPTLISLDSIVEGRAPPAASLPAASPLSPTGPTAPPLTLPPVVAGAPPLSTVPMRPPPPMPAQFAGLPSHASAPPASPPLSLGSPHLGLQGLHGLGQPPTSPGMPTWPPPGVPLGLPGLPPPSLAMLGGAMPHCPPPSHPAPTPLAAQTQPSATSSTSAPALAPAPTTSASNREESSSTAPLISEKSEPDSTASVAERLADTLGGGFGLARHLAEPLGGAMQLARGPLAGVPLLPGEQTLRETPLSGSAVGVGAVGEAVGASLPSSSPPPPPTGPASLPASSSTAPTLLGTMPVGLPPPVHLSTLPPPHGLPPQGFPMAHHLQGPLLAPPPMPGMLPPGGLPPLGLAPGGPLLGGLHLPGLGAPPPASLLGFAGYPHGPPPASSAMGLLPTASPPPLSQAPGLSSPLRDLAVSGAVALSGTHPGSSSAPPSLPPGMPPSLPP